MPNPNIHILGIQGSGKGTQSALLVKKYGFSYLASGELFRSRAAIDDTLGRTLKDDLTAGKLISDDLLSKVIEDHLKRTDIKTGLLGDGVIRTESQVDLFAPLWEANDLEQPYLVFMKLSEEIALQRIQNRQREQIEQGLVPRADDTPEAIERRFKLFHTMTEPVVSLFERSGRCIRISADKDIESIHQDICKAIEAIYPSLHGSH